MKLRRIDAVRYGALVNAGLGELGDGLTVVYGPNEAGKSTYTSLVRHLVYGFPTKAQSTERGYHTESGKRQGRLHLEDASGTWVLERVEGPHGGPTTVLPPPGAARRDGLAEELKRGSTEQTYRIAFGFGLKELGDLDGLKNEALRSRLLTAGAGLAVNPSDVRKELKDRADAIWAQRSRTKELDRINDELKGVRQELRALDEQAEEYARRRADLEKVEAELRESELERDETAARAHALRRVLETLASAEERIAQARVARETAEAEMQDVDRRIADVDVDEDLLAKAEAVDVVTDGLSGFRERLSVLARERGELEESRSRELSEAEALGPGWTVQRAEQVVSGAAVSNQVGDWGRRLSREEADVVRAEESLAQAETWARAAAPAPVRTGLLAPIALLLTALAIAVAAVPRSEWLFAGLAVLPAAAAAALLLTRSAGRRRLPHVEQDGLSAARQRVEQARSASAKGRDEWSQWLGSHGLAECGTDPEDIAALLDGVRRLKEASGRARRLEESVLAKEEACEAYVAKAVAAGVAQPAVAWEELPSVVDRARQALSAAKDARARLRELQSERSRLSADQERAAAALESAEADRRSALAEHAAQTGGRGEDASAAEVEADAERCESEAGDARSSHEDLIARLSALRTELKSAERENAGAELRLRRTALLEKGADAVTRYAVLAVAERLLGEAQRKWEEEHQPALVARAQEIVREATDGRYEALRISEDEEIVLAGPDAGIKGTDALSRGTAELLYLALRIAHIEELADAGPDLPVLMDDVLVDLDAERAREAASAIASLAEKRQVVLFTCHHSTAELFSQVAPGHTELSLERC